MAPHNDVQKKFQDLMSNRKKQKKNEDLAQQIFGSGRRTSNSPANASLSPGGSFSSRVGVGKRSVSVASKPKNNGAWPQNLEESVSNRSRFTMPRANSTSQLERAARLQSSLENSTRVDSRPSRPPTAGQLRIRGAAASGPYVVMASNFATGTTAADIEASMGAVAGDILRCRVLSASPTVLAEIECADREGAENIIASFNGASADGHILYVYMKQGGPTPVRSERPLNSNPAREPTPAQTAAEPIPEPTIELKSEPGHVPEDVSKSEDIMVVDTVGDRRGAFHREFGRLESHERSVPIARPDGRYNYDNGGHGYPARGGRAGGYYRGGQQRDPRGYLSRSYNGRY